MLEQVTPYLMTVNGAVAYAAGGQPVASFNDLPLELDGEIPHVAGILIDVEFSPTFTTAPTIYGANNLVSAIVVNDGVNPRLDVAGFNAMRSFDIFETGDVMTPDPDLNGGTGNRIRLSRLWLPGPANFKQGDFMLPTPCIRNGELRMTWGALTGVSADTTAITINRLSVIALLATRPGQMILPPFLERRTQLLTSSAQSIQGSGAYATIGLTKTNYAAFASGDLTSILVDTGRGVRGGMAIPAAAYDAVNQSILRAGQFTKVRGEFATATVDNEKTVNLSTPTAIVAADATHQSVYTTPKGGMITKVPVEGSNIKLSWPGTLTNVNAQYSRLVPQSPTAYAAMAIKGCAEMKKDFQPANLKIATASKTTFTRDPSIMPFKYKTGKAA